MDEPLVELGRDFCATQPPLVICHPARKGSNQESVAVIWFLRRAYSFSLYKI
jgi:hypothetical protein